MNTPAAPKSLDFLRRTDAACDQFETAWRCGRQPRIEDYLVLFKAEERLDVLASLQQLQQELILTGLAKAESPPPRPAAPGRAAGVDDGEVAARPAVPDARRSDSRDRVAATWIAATPCVHLRVTGGPNAGLEFSYSGYDTLLVGRSPRAQLRIKDDQAVSRHHLRLEVNPPTCYLMDLQSRNGTYVNGERVSDRFLEDGDVVSVGETTLAVAVLPPVLSPRGAGPKAQAAADPGRPAKAEQPGPDVRASASAAAGPVSFSIPGYEIREQVGSGELGAVYRATRVASGERCALKVIRATERHDERAIQAFLREVAILNELSHPHIVRFLEMGTSNSDLYLSTEYVESIPWARLAARFSPAHRIRIACGLMAQVLGALQYAHTRALVHRDVKPGNVLIEKRDGKLFAKLADFGLAKRYTSAGMSRVTRSGDVVGSLPFMSPEQFVNSRDAKPPCDIYSAGATLYWMLAGCEPIPLGGGGCKFLAILEAAPVPLKEHCRDAPDGLCRLVRRALEKDPEQRFSSAAEMRHQLRQLFR